jgi:hypothetical protein
VEGDGKQRGRGGFWERQVQRAGKQPSGDKKIFFWQKHLLTLNFYGSTLPPTSLNPDRRRVQHERYGGSNPDKKKNSIIFDLYRMDLSPYQLIDI